MDVRDLPTVNAALNALSFALLTSGFVLVRRGQRDAHRACMLAAFGCSILFLTSYLVYHAQVGSVRFEGIGVVRKIYLGVLVSHSVLAAGVPFLAIATLYRALRGRFESHVALARVTLPIWLYVSATGVVVYWMLYRLPVSS